MRTKLLLYMLVPVLLLFVILATCLSLFDRFKTPKDTLAERLDTQAMSFEKEILSHRNNLVTVGTHLSEDASALIERYIEESDTPLSAMNGTHLAALQERLIDPLRQYLLQADCSGAFVLFNASAGTGEGATTRSGLYLQVNGYESDRREMILYRGISAVGKAHGIMPHRKWRLETSGDVICGFDDEADRRAFPSTLAYRFSDVFTLPGMSEKATLLMLPVEGNDGRVLGVCGFEVSDSCFNRLHSQSTKLPHFTGVLTHKNGEGISSYLSCGSDDGYYRTPGGALSLSDFGDGILSLTDEKGGSYLGMKRTLTDSRTGEGFTVLVMTDKSDYDRAAADAFVKNMFLILLLIGLSVAFCFYFSRSYLSPVLKSLERLKQDEKAAHRHAPSEIDDLFAFLAEKDKNRREAIDALTREMEKADGELSRIQEEKTRVEEEYERAKTQISRLSSAAMQEVDPDGYAHFSSNLCRLTPKEREIFDLYLAGKNGKEIRDSLGITENTLKYHNKNIYQTLNIASRKELLRYAALMEGNKKESGTSSARQ